MTTGQELVDEVALLLRDPNKRQWTQPRLISALASAYQALCKSKPDAYTVTENITLVQGTEQSAPADVHTIQEIICNVCPASGKQMRAITKADKSAMDASFPLWRNDPSKGHIRQWMNSQMDEHRFFVWPQARKGDVIRAILAKTPGIVDIGERPVVPSEPTDPGPGALQAQYQVDLTNYNAAVTALANYETLAANNTDLSDDILVDAVYLPFLREWMLYYSYQVDDEMTINARRAESHFRKAFDLIGLRASAQQFMKIEQEMQE